MTVLQKLRRHWGLVFLNLVVLSFFLANATGIIHWRFIDRMENLSYDARMLLSMKSRPDPRIIIVDIDEKSLANEGRWPWPRDKMARFLDILFDHYGVAMVGFDIVFAEPDRSSGLDVLDNLAENELSDVPQFRDQYSRLHDQLDYDHLFAASMDGRPVVLGYYFNAASEGSGTILNGALPPPVFTARDKNARYINAPRAAGYGANLEELQQHAASGGHFNPTIDNDGIVRRVPMLYEFSGGYYEALSLAMARKVLNVDQVKPVIGRDPAGNITGLEWLRIGYNRIPVDANSQALVPYRGLRGSFPYISATDVLNKTAIRKILENRIILVGTTAPGLFDLRSTPVQSKYPGVEIHANLIAGMLDQKIKQRPVYTKGIEFIHLLITGLIIALLFPLLTPLWTMLATGFLLVASISINFYAWENWNIVLPIASIILLILAMFLLNMSYGFFIERKRKSEITNLFGQYVPPELVEEMSNDPESYSHEAQDREMTVLFSDVRGFTTLSEGLSPKELSSLINELLTSMTSIIHENRGTIDKYMGDCVMAFWGAPIHDPEHAKHAVKAGLAMIDRMYVLQDEFEAQGWPRLKIGVGINTGVMSVGNMGSRFRTAYTILGDAVNLGSRLEGLTKQYGVDILVGENTRNTLPDHPFRELDLVRVKGKKEPVAIFEPLSVTGEISEKDSRELELMNQALQLYRKQAWKEAEAIFNTLKKDYSDRYVYQLYLERIDYFKGNPPGADWDGAFTFTIK